jgi:hypothetical protein
MPPPNFDRLGELPAGVHQATMDEVITRFGSATPQRQAVTARLLRIYNLLISHRQTGTPDHLRELYYNQTQSQ